MLVAVPQPPLVGLPVHRDEALADLGEDAHGRAATPDVRAGATVGPHRAGEQEAVADVGPRVLGPDERRVSRRDADDPLDHGRLAP